MPRFMMPGPIFLHIVYAMAPRAEQRSTALIRLPLADESVIISVEKPVYFPGGTVHLSITRDDPGARVTVTPILTIEGTTLLFVGTMRISPPFLKTLPPDHILFISMFWMSRDVAFSMRQLASWWSKSTGTLSGLNGIRESVPKTAAKI